MKKIKIIIALLISSTIILSVPACKKSFLDKPPGVDLNEDVIFSSKSQLDTYLATIYRYLTPNILTTGDRTFAPIVNSVYSDALHGTLDVSDEGDASDVDFIASNVWNNGGVLASNITTVEDVRYYQRWYGLRQVAIMLKRIDEVPDATADYKNQVKGEVKALRAICYLELVKRYGGVPIVDQIFDPGANITSLVPRASIDDVFKFIVKNCDEAIAALPLTQSASLTGRMTSLAARAIKAKALLYAASPLFNTATPYLDLGANNKLICYGNYDKNRWKLAADAALDVIKNAAASNVKLVDVPAARSLAFQNRNGVGNYSNMWEIKNNSELILTFQGHFEADNQNAPLVYIVPTGFNAYWSGVSATLNFVKRYEKLDGTPQTWDAAGGTDLLGKIDQLDPRFKQTIVYTASYFNPNYQIASIYAGGGNIYDLNKGGFYMHKLIPRTTGRSVPVDITLRLGEFYLDYAEAQNEFDSPGTATPAYPTVTPTLNNPTGINFLTASVADIPNSPNDAVNKIRLRSGMPQVPEGLSQAQFRDRIRNERNIELCYEEHRFWDIKRWLIAENDGVMQGAMQGIRITKVGTTPAPNDKYTWLPYVFETRTWLRKMYLHPFPQAEVLKGNLVQNPGW